MIRFLPKAPFPFLVPLTLWMWGGMLILLQLDDPTEHQGTGPSNSDAMHWFGAVLVVLVAAVLQAVVGLPTLWLFRKLAKLWQFALLGAMIGAGLALLCWWCVIHEVFPPPPLPALLISLTAFVPPCVAGYALAFHFECHRPVKEWSRD